MGAGPRNAHALSAAPPTRRSAPLGHFRLFVLNSGRDFSPALGGDPEGAAPPPPSGAAPACAPLVRSRDGRSVSPPPARPGPRRPLFRPRPRPVSGPGRLRTPAGAPAPLVLPGRGATPPLSGPQGGRDPGTDHKGGPDLRTGHREGQTLQWVTEEGPGSTGSQDKPPGRTRPQHPPPGRDQKPLDPETGH